MNATDIISVASAKDWLSTDDETHLPRLIKSAISYVEEYTGYRLYQRTTTIQIPFYGYGIPDYPITIQSVKNSSGQDIPYTSTTGVYNTYVAVPTGSYVYATVGYANTDDIPSELIDAAYKMLTYLYENRDMYELTLPTDVKMLISKLRRDLI